MNGELTPALRGVSSIQRIAPPAPVGYVARRKKKGMTLMQRIAVLGLLAFTIAGSGCSSSSAPVSTGGGDAGGSSTTGEDAGGRTVVTCAQVETLAKDGSLTWVAGSWGTVPTGLQSLPTGASLCGRQYSAEGDGGVAGFDSVEVVSTLFGQPLLSFYAPLATSAGCTQEQSSVGPASTYVFSCPNQYVLSVVANPDETYYSVSYGQ
jgi:hypothetical protein